MFEQTCPCFLWERQHSFYSPMESHMAGAAKPTAMAMLRLEKVIGIEHVVEIKLCCRDADYTLPLPRHSAAEFIPFRRLGILLVLFSPNFIISSLNLFSSLFSSSRKPTEHRTGTLYLLCNILQMTSGIQGFPDLKVQTWGTRTATRLQIK